MNLPRIPNKGEAYMAGVVTRLYLARLLAAAPALAWVFLRGLRDRKAVGW